LPIAVVQCGVRRQKFSLLSHWFVLILDMNPPFFYFLLFLSVFFFSSSSSSSLTVHRYIHLYNNIYLQC
jgi:hypothetical protein